MTGSPTLKPGDKVVAFGRVLDPGPTVTVNHETDVGTRTTTTEVLSRCAFSFTHIKPDPTPILKELFLTLNRSCGCLHPDTIHDVPHCPNADLPILARAKAWLEGR